VFDIVETKFKNIIRRLKSFFKKEIKSFQLELFLPLNRRGKRAYAMLEGYCLRVFSNDDRAEIVELMQLAGFQKWNFDVLQQALYLCVPNGAFVLVESKTNKIVAMMMARHVSDAEHQCGGRIDWLAVDPRYRGKSFGYIVASAATNRLIDINYGNIYVTTDDHRLAAIKTFLKIGFIPNVYRPEMYERWRKLCSNLNVPFQPEQWDKIKKDLKE